MVLNNFYARFLTIIALGVGLYASPTWAHMTEEVSFAFSWQGKPEKFAYFVREIQAILGWRVVPEENSQTVIPIANLTTDLDHWRKLAQLLPRILVVGGIEKPMFLVKRTATTEFVAAGDMLAQMDRTGLQRFQEHLKIEILGAGALAALQRQLVLMGLLEFRVANGLGVIDLGAVHFENARYSVDGDVGGQDRIDLNTFRARYRQLYEIEHFKVHRFRQVLEMEGSAVATPESLAVFWSNFSQKFHHRAEELTCEASLRAGPVGSGRGHE